MPDKSVRERGRGEILVRAAAIKELLDAKGVGAEIWQLQRNTVTFRMDTRQPMGEFLELLWERWSDVTDVSQLAEVPSRYLTVIFDWEP